MPGICQQRQKTSKDGCRPVAYAWHMPVSVKRRQKAGDGVPGICPAYATRTAPQMPSTDLLRLYARYAKHMLGIYAWDMPIACSTHPPRFKLPHLCHIGSPAFGLLFVMYGTYHFEIFGLGNVFSTNGWCRSPDAKLLPQKDRH